MCEECEEWERCVRQQHMCEECEEWERCASFLYESMGVLWMPSSSIKLSSTCHSTRSAADGTTHAQLQTAGSQKWHSGELGEHKGASGCASGGYPAGKVSHFDCFLHLIVAFVLLLLLLGLIHSPRGLFDRFQHISCH